MSKEMTDKEFLGYVEIHSKTPRALFSAAHLKRLLMLSGEPHEHLDDQGFYCLRYEEARPFIFKAHRALDEKKRLTAAEIAAVQRFVAASPDLAKKLTPNRKAKP